MPAAWVNLAPKGPTIHSKIQASHGHSIMTGSKGSLDFLITDRLTKATEKIAKSLLTTIHVICF
jgi:hypothetical protein